MPPEPSLSASVMTAAASRARRGSICWAAPASTSASWCTRRCSSPKTPACGNCSRHGVAGATSLFSRSGAALPSHRITKEASWIIAYQRGNNSVPTTCGYAIVTNREQPRSTREHAQGVVWVPGIRKHVLRAWRRSRGWAVPELARRLARAAQEGNVPIARGGHDSLKRMIYQWEDEKDKHVPGEHYQLLYVKALALRCLEELLVGPPGYTGPAVSAGLSVPPQRPVPAGIEHLIMAVAGESADYASSEVGRSVAPLSVVHLTAELQRLARSYSALPPLELLGQARKLRDESRLLSERTRKPVQLADLHLVTGGACGLLAMASWDLGAWSAAIEQAHAAGNYGEVVGHRGLQAWAAGFEGLIVFWRGRPREAADVVASGLELAPRGTARARLHCIAARAWAYLGAVDRVRLQPRYCHLVS